MLLRESQWVTAGAVCVANELIEDRAFPGTILPTLTPHQEAHGGVGVWMERAVRECLRT